MSPATEVKRGQRTPHPYVRDPRYHHHCRCGLVHQNPIHSPAHASQTTGQLEQLLRELSEWQAWAVDALADIPEPLRTLHRDRVRKIEADALAAYDRSLAPETAE